MIRKFLYYFRVEKPRGKPKSGQKEIGVWTEGRGSYQFTNIGLKFKNTTKGTREQF